MKPADVHKYSQTKISRKKLFNQRVNIVNAAKHTNNINQIIILEKFYVYKKMYKTYYYCKNKVSIKHMDF